ncbi:MAG: ribonuclease HI [Helicobacter sp.]|nr:ribonuclease HI [Helicobacter sp.]
MKHIDIFTDGSCLSNPGYGGWCAILKYKDKEKVLCGSEKMTTNNRMELQALIEALKMLKEPCKIMLFSDSQYVVSGITEWLNGWIKRGFIEVKNPDLWRQYIALIKPHDINAHWVKGHNNHEENERCDKIAKDSAIKLKETYEPGLFK